MLYPFVLIYESINKEKRSTYFIVDFIDIFAKSSLKLSIRIACINQFPAIKTHNIIRFYSIHLNPC